VQSIAGLFAKLAAALPDGGQSTVLEIVTRCAAQEPAAGPNPATVLSEE
jgi:hypothetical protein